MDTQNENREMLSPYVSVDCVLLGINDDKLTVLLACLLYTSDAADEL